MDNVTNLRGLVFACDKCGACCKHLREAGVLPDFDRGDGICKYLNSKNECDIYNTRPDICRGDYVYNRFYHGMDVEDYYKMSHLYCKKIREMQL